MRRLTAILVFYISAFGIELYSQDLPPIQLDRPDQTECPFIVPKNYIQCEAGFGLERTTGSVTTATLPTALWKYGVNEKFELRFITEVTRVASGGITTLGLAPITVGFKSSLFEESGIIPKTSFIGHITTSNLGSKDFQTTYIAPSFRFVMLHNLAHDISLSYNLGAEWDGFRKTPDWIYTIAPGINVGENGYAYVEAYGSVRRGSSPQHSLAGGVAYYLTDDWKIDFSGSYGLTEAATDHYIAIGFSFRTPTKKR